MTAALGEPFASAAEAWFWTMEALRARHIGSQWRAATRERPCSPDDVLKALDRLYRQRAIDLADAELLRRYGERGYAPSPPVAAERADRLVWDRIMGRLEAALQARGIVRRPEQTETRRVA